MGDVQEALKNLVERLHEAAKDNLESIILYGSAARGDFHDAHSDLNVLCILRSLRAAELARVSAVVKWWTTAQHQRAPLFFGAEELASRSGGARVAHSPVEVAAALSARGGKPAGTWSRPGQIVLQHADAASAHVDRLPGAAGKCSRRRFRSGCRIDGRERAGI